LRETILSFEIISFCIILTYAHMHIHTHILLIPRIKRVGQTIMYHCNRPYPYIFFLLEYLKSEEPKKGTSALI
jgi:hypothetical protein